MCVCVYVFAYVCVCVFVRMSVKWNVQEYRDYTVQGRLAHSAEPSWGATVHVGVQNSNNSIYCS